MRLNFWICMSLLFLSYIVSFAGCGDGEKNSDPCDCVDNNNGTISDKTTGLMWMKASGTGFWDDASQNCAELSLAGYDDWRLPTIDELRTLVFGCPDTKPTGACQVHDDCHTLSCLNAACSSCDFKQGPGLNGSYQSQLFDAPEIWDLWSSTKVGVFSAWLLDFSNGNVVSWELDKTHGYRCVRP